MKRVLVAGALSGLLILATPALALSADRDGRDSRGAASHSDNRGDHGHYANDRSSDGGYSSDDPYYDGGYQDCHRDPSGSVTCEPYGGDYDPGGYHDSTRDPYSCDHPRSARSDACREDDPRGANNGVPPGTVVIRDRAFNPATINARVGKAVLWNFDDHGVAHTVTADNGSFDSGRRSSGEFQLAFPEPGVYHYHCAVHPDMRGTVVVGRES